MSGNMSDGQGIVPIATEPPRPPGMADKFVQKQTNPHTSSGGVRCPLLWNRFGTAGMGGGEAEWLKAARQSHVFRDAWLSLLCRGYSCPIEKTRRKFACTARGGTRHIGYSPVARQRSGGGASELLRWPRSLHGRQHPPNGDGQADHRCDHDPGRPPGRGVILRRNVSLAMRAAG